MKQLTYLIYFMYWEGLTFGWISYAVFGLGYSEWYMILAVMLGCWVIKPERWYGEVVEPVQQNTANFLNFLRKNKK
jgi:hypothetical protein